MLAIYRQNEKKEWVLSTVFADTHTVASDMWRDWFEKDGDLTRVKIVKSVSDLTDTLEEETEIEDPAPLLGSFHM